jgi:hypothetical protein
MKQINNFESSQRFNPLNDYLFYKVMGVKGNEVQLLGFLNAVLGRSGKKTIKDVEILENNFIAAEIINGKSCILDVRAILEDGTKVNIEVQLRNENNMERRSLFYWSRMYSESINQGHDYQELPNVIAINIVDFDFPPGGNFHTCFHLREDAQPDLILTPALEIHFINMARWRRIYDKDIKNILISSKPSRWIGTPLAGLLTAAVTFSLSGCAGEDLTPQGSENPGTAILTPAVTPTVHILMGDVPSPYQEIFQGTYIPFFEFGDGTGGIGCMAITAPVFMTEEEAFEVIAAAFAESGLYLDKPSGYRPDVNLPVTNIDGEEVDRNKTVQGTLESDEMFKLWTHDLTVKFVSVTDVINWREDPDATPTISFSTFNIKQTAETLAENNTAMVVFYDPVAGMVDYLAITRDIEREAGESDEAFYDRLDAIREDAHREALAESEQMLRKQVEAFIAWLFQMGG